MAGDNTRRRKGRKKGRHPERALSAAFVRTVTEPGRYCDGNGLYLHVDPSGARRWVQRLVIQGRNRMLGLGGCALVSLAEARAMARRNRKTARAGRDPRAGARTHAAPCTCGRPAVPAPAAPAPPGGAPAFEDAAAEVFTLHRPAWRSERHATQWLRTLQLHAFPVLGARPVSDIDTADVMAVLAPIWHEKPETARRVRQRIGKVMQWSIALGWRDDNPAGEAIGAALPKPGRGRRHFRALPHGEVGAAVAAVRRSGAAPAARLAFEFLVLTAARSGEARAAEWREMHPEAAEWRVPAARMKAGRAHRVPLSDRALATLAEARALDDGGGLVFPGARAGRPLADSTLSKLLRTLGLDAVVHGFRSSFRDWAAECTDAPHAAMEAALAHGVHDRVEAAYRRTDLFERRRALMAEWAAYLGAVEGGAGGPGGCDYFATSLHG